MTYSRETWKLLLTKTSAVLDEALIMVAHVVSNMVMGSFCDEINIVRQFNCFNLFSNIFWIFLQIITVSHFSLSVDSVADSDGSVCNSCPGCAWGAPFGLDQWHAVERHQFHLCTVWWRPASILILRLRKPSAVCQRQEPHMSNLPAHVCEVLTHMIQYDMIHYSVGQYGMISREILWYSLILCNSISYNMMYGMIWCDIVKILYYYTFQCSTIIRYDIIPYNTIRYNVIWS